MRYMLFDRWGNLLLERPPPSRPSTHQSHRRDRHPRHRSPSAINQRRTHRVQGFRWAAGWNYLCQSTQTARAAGMPRHRRLLHRKASRNSRARHRGQTQPCKRTPKPRLTKALEAHPVGGRHSRDRQFITGTAPRILPPRTVLDAVQKTADTYGLEVQTEYQPDPTGNQIGRAHHPPRRTPGPTNTTKRFEYGKRPHPNQTRHRQRRRHHPLRVGQRHRTKTNDHHAKPPAIQPQDQLRRRQRRQTLRPRRLRFRQLGHTRPRRHQTPQRGKRGLPRPRRPQGTPLTLTKNALKTCTTPVAPTRPT